MPFLSNKTINHLNLHLALMSLLEQAFIVFMPIFLYTHGFSVAWVLMLLASMLVLRMPMRLLSLPVIRRWGLKKAVMIGAAGYALTFPILGHIRAMDGWLVLYLLMYSVFNAMHWLAFHTLYSMAGDPEKRGRQVAAAYAATAILSAAAPLLSSLVIVAFGFQVYFMMAPVLAFIMILTLVPCDTVLLPRLRWRDARGAILGMGTRIHLMESAAQYPMCICWLFVVYLYVGKIMPLGGIIAFGVMVRAVYQLLLGVLVDKGRGTLIVNYGETLRCLTIIGRAFLPLSLPCILGLEAASGVGDVHHLAVQPTALYNAAKHSPYPFWYWMFAEMAWDTGSFIGAASAALLLWQGVPLREVILLALPFTLVLWWVLHRYFARHAYVHPAA